MGMLRNEVIDRALLRGLDLRRSKALSIIERRGRDGFRTKKDCG